MAETVSMEPLTQMLKSIALQKRTGLLRIERFGGKNAEQGEIYFEGGRPMRARAGQEGGKAAFQRMSEWKYITCSFHGMSRPYPVTTRVLATPKEQQTEGKAAARPPSYGVPQTGESGACAGIFSGQSGNGPASALRREQRAGANLAANQDCRGHAEASNHFPGTGQSAAHPARCQAGRVYARAYDQTIARHRALDDTPGLGTRNAAHAAQTAGHTTPGTIARRRSSSRTNSRFQSQSYDRHHSGDSANGAPRAHHLYSAGRTPDNSGYRPPDSSTRV